MTDLDGTLWDRSEVIHRRTLAALAHLEAQGVPLLVATGRRLRSAQRTLARYGLAPAAIVLDGVVGQDLATAVRFHKAPFAPDDAVAAVEAFEEAGLSPCVYVDRPDADVVVGERPSTHPLHLRALAPWLAKGDLLEVAASEPVLAVGVAGQEPAVLVPVAERLRHAAQAVATRDIVLGGATLIARAPGVSKWNGVLAYCAREGLDPDRVLAVGDGENDLELLEGAQVSCVVRDGCTAALALADHVIASPCEGGWSQVLELV